MRTPTNKSKARSPSAVKLDVLIDQRERTIIEATENLSRLMESRSVNKADLARALGTSRAWVTQMLSGDRNMTLNTLSDAFCALGASVHIGYGALSSAIVIVDVPKEEAADWLTADLPDWGSGTAHATAQWTFPILHCLSSRDDGEAQASGETGEVAA